MFGEVIDIALDVDTVAASSGVDLKSAFGARKASQPGYGRKGVVAVMPIGSTSNQAGNIQTSPDNSDWSNAQAYDASAGPKLFNVVLDRYIRINNASGTTVGTNFQLLV